MGADRVKRLEALLELVGEILPAPVAAPDELRPVRVWIRDWSLPERTVRGWIRDGVLPVVGDREQLCRRSDLLRVVDHLAQRPALTKPAPDAQKPEAEVDGYAALVAKRRDEARTKVARERLRLVGRGSR